MAKPRVKFPIVCPECGQEGLTALASDLAIEALMRGKTIRLHSNCHDKWWDASSVELEQLREYMSALGLAIQSEPPKPKNAPHIQLVIDNTAIRPYHEDQKARLD